VKHLAIVDVETTGTSAMHDEIIDIGVVLVDEMNIVGQWESLVKPNRSVSPFITSITGITNDDLVSAPRFEDIADTLMELIDDRVFVAHNARFDYAFLKYSFERMGRSFLMPHVCTVRLSRTLFPQERRHNLDSIINRFHIHVENRHRALPDSLAVYQFLQKAYLLTESTFEAAWKTISRRPSLPPHLPETTFHSLPETVGVYIFYDRNGMPLYVGKSKQIKQRVLSHFYDDLKSSREMTLKQETHHIEAIVCAGELDALLTEAALVKELLPVHNRMLRRKKGYWVVWSDTNEAGYTTLSITMLKHLTFEDLTHVMALANSKTSLKKLLHDKTHEFRLCPKLTGLENGKGACFATHLQTCDGACEKKEKTITYNLKVLQAFAGHTFEEWPYDKPIVIHERNEAYEKEAFVVVDKWMVVQRAKTEADIGLNIRSGETIDADDYRILKAYLKKYGTGRGGLKIHTNGVYSGNE